MYAVCVTFSVIPGHEDTFLAAARAQAEASLSREEGCQVFDVLTDASRPGEVFLYELYADRAAFDAHLKTSHFRAFDETTAPMVAVKAVRCWDGVYRPCASEAA